MSLRKEIPVALSCSASSSTPNMGAYAEEIRSNASVTGNLNSQFKYMQTSDGPYQEMSKGASVKNRYLEKIAMSKAMKGAAKAFGGSSTVSKVSLGLSTAGLGLSAANYHNGKISAKAQIDKANLERKSLSALNNINKTLSTATLHPSPIASPMPKFNKPTNKV